MSRPRRISVWLVAATTLAASIWFGFPFGPSTDAAADAQTPYPGGTWEPGDAQFATELVRDVGVVMSDGIRLDAVVAYPADPTTGERVQSEFPVVIEHTPYTSEEIPPGLGPVNTYYAEHGYISVRINSRGTGKSEGAHSFFGPLDASDGAEIVDWAAHGLDGSDGRVASVGCSFAGGHALSGAAAVGPDSPLKAVVAACIGLDTIQRHDLLVSGVPTQDQSFLHYASPDLMGGNVETTNRQIAISEEMVRGGDAAYARDFWAERMPTSQAQDIVDNEIPVLLWTGWEDLVGIGAFRTYTALQNAYSDRPLFGPMSSEQSATPRYQLISGDWAHTGGLDNGIILQWLDTWVKGEDTSMQTTETPMHVLESGTERWVNLSQYPAVPDYTPWYLGDSGRLTTAAPNSDGRQTITWGEPTQPGSSLSFASEPVADGATLAGAVSATVYASSSNTNLALVAHLTDVAPDGTEREITRGSMMGSLRNLDQDASWLDGNETPRWPWQTLERDEYMTPDQVYRFDVLLEPRQWGVQPGHSLRLDLTTRPPSEHCPGPAYIGALTPGVPANEPCYLTEPQIATVPGGTYTIISNDEFPSSLNLPQTAAGTFSDAGCAVTPTSDEVCLPNNWGAAEQTEVEASNSADLDNGGTPAVVYGVAVVAASGAILVLRRFRRS